MYFNNITYNKKVFIIKKLLFITLIALFLFLVLIILFGFIKKNNPLLFVQIFGGEAIKVNKNQSYLSGILKDGTKYFLTSSNFTKDINNILNQNNQVLFNPIINLESKNTSIIINANEGLVDTNLKTLSLTNNININTNTGLFIKLNQMLYNINNNSLISTSDIFAKYNNFTINSIGLNITNNVLQTNSVIINNDIDKIYLTTNFLTINNLQNQIILDQNAFFKNQSFSISANNIKIDYLQLQNFSLNFNPNNIKTIRAIENVVIELSSNDKSASIIKGYQYLYSAKDDVMFVSVNKKIKNDLVFYNSENINITAYNRLEYQPKANLLIAWGYPNLEIKTDNINKSIYNLSAKTLTAQINNNQKDIEIVEAFDNVLLTFKDETIKSNYAVFNNTSKIIIFEGNVLIKDSKKSIQGCKLIVKLEEDTSDLIACDDKDNKIEIKK